MCVLLEECLRDDRADAWTDFFHLYVKATGTPLRRFVRTCGGNDQDAEDLSMEVLVSLCGESRRKLRTFRGENQAQLVCWLRCVALNHARNWIKARLRRTLHVHLSELDFCVCESGPTEEEIRSLMEELSEVARQAGSPIDDVHVERLGLLAGLRDESDEFDELSERTIRHWKHDLVHRLRALLNS